VCLLGVTSAFADLAEMQQRGTLRVLVSADELPEMFALEPGEKPGLEREMLEAFARVNGLEIEAVPVENFEQIIPALLDDRGDLIVGIVDTESRRGKIAFTVETLPARHLAVNRKPAPPIDSLEALRKARVGVVIASSWAEAALDAGVEPANMEAYDMRQGVLEGLRSGAVEALVMTLPDFAQARQADDALQVGTFVGPPASGAWGLRKEDEALRQALNTHLKALQQSPAWGGMVLRYFSQDALELLAKARN
jgi:lysine/arginine/ornithine transport system substrate-binding protein